VVCHYCYKNSRNQCFKIIIKSRMRTFWASSVIVFLDSLIYFQESTMCL
jgi:hypothetical protein